MGAAVFQTLSVPRSSYSELPNAPELSCPDISSIANSVTPAFSFLASSRGTCSNSRLDGFSACVLAPFLSVVVFEHCRTRCQRCRQRVCPPRALWSSEFAQATGTKHGQHMTRHHQTMYTLARVMTGRIVHSGWSRSSQTSTNNKNCS